MNENDPFDPGVAAGAATAPDPLATQLGIAPPGHPLRASDLLMTSARAFGARPILMALAALFAYLPAALIEGSLTLAGEASDSVLGSWPSRLATALLVPIGSGMIAATALGWFEGRRVTVGEALSTGFTRGPGVFLMLWAMRLCLFGAALPGLIVFGVGGTTGNPILQILFGVVGVAAAVFGCGYVYARLSPALPLVVSGTSRGGGAVGASWRWTKGNSLPLIGAYAVLTLAALVLSCIVFSPFVLWGAVHSADGAFEQAPLFVVLSSGAGLALQVVLEISTTVLATVIYARLGGVQQRVDVDELVDVFS